MYIVKIDKKQNPLSQKIVLVYHNVFGFFVRHPSWSVEGDPVHLVTFVIFIYGMYFLNCDFAGASTNKATSVSCVHKVYIKSAMTRFLASALVLLKIAEKLW